MALELELLQDLDDYERFLTWRSASREPEARLDAPVMRDLALLAAETSKIAAFAAAAASLAMHAMRSPATPGTVPRSPFTVAFSSAAEGRVAMLPQTTELFELNLAWIEVQARLSFANTLAGERASAAAAAISPDLVADAWTRACVALLAWHRKLAAVQDAAAGADALPRRRPGEVEAFTLLGQVAAGAAPCIDAEGMLTLPGWAERRRETRRAVSIPVTAMVGLDSFEGRLDNISRGGLGLSLDASLPVGAAVSLALPADRVHCGRILAGRVRWSEPHGAGIALDEPLEDDDPLWLAASRAAGH